MGHAAYPPPAPPQRPIYAFWRFLTGGTTGGIVVATILICVILAVCSGVLTSLGVLPNGSTSSNGSNAGLVTSPTDTPYPTYTPAPTDTPLPPPLAITFTCAAAVDYSYGRVCVHTHAGAALSITVTYCSGADAKSASLQGTVHANSHGNYEWDWTPETNCHGQATASVFAQWGNQEGDNSTAFTVR